MTIAIIGGAGYIGSHCAKYLHEMGHNIVVYDKISNPRLAPLPCYQGDLKNTHALRSFLQDHAVSSVIHCAGKIDVAESVQNPELYHTHNVTYTRSLLDIMVELGIEELIFSSSCAVYGSPRFQPLTETHPFAPISPYGETKVAVEKMLEAYAQRYVFRYVSLRFFNAAGAAPDGSLGENHEPETHLIPKVLEHIHSGSPLGIYGNDYNTVDGTCVRDYIHVWDIAQAHLKALAYLRSQKGSNTFNLGSERGYSVKEVIDMAEKVTKKPVTAQHFPRRAGDPPVLVSSSKKARHLLNWEPQHTQLQNMVEDAWRFIQNESKIKTVRH